MTPDLNVRDAAPLGIVIHGTPTPAAASVLGEAPAHLEGRIARLLRRLHVETGGGVA